MLKKSIPLILLIFVLLSFDCIIKAMEAGPSNKRRKIVDQKENESSELVQSNSNFEGALLYVQLLKNEGKDISVILNHIDQDNYISEEFKTNCKRIIINEHCTSLKQNGFAKEKFNITDDNLNNYENLLYVMLGKRYEDLNCILSIFDNCYQLRFEDYSAKLADINILLTVLIRYDDSNTDSTEIASEDEKKSIWLVVDFFLWCCDAEEIKKVSNNFCKLLAKYNLFPALDYMLYNQQIFLMGVIYYGDIEFFHYIINRERDKNYNWKNLFSIQDNSFQETILHKVVCSRSKYKAKVILKLLKEKGLYLRDFINITDACDDNPIQLALSYGCLEIVELFNKYIDIEMHKIIKQQPFCSLRLQAALAINECKNSINLVNKLPTDLQDYCNACLMIDSFCKFLEKNQKISDLKITSKNLTNCRCLLYEMLEKQYYQIHILLSGFKYYIQEIMKNHQKYTITLEGINFLLKSMIKIKEGTTLDIDEVGNIANILLTLYTSCSACTELCCFLANIPFITLNFIVDRYQTNYFMAVAKFDCDTKLFDIIVGLAKNNPSYSWVELFNMRDIFGKTVLHHAVNCEDKIKIILNLILDKNLNINDFINVKDSSGKTPLMYAAEGHPKVIPILINIGAQVDLKCNYGYDSLYYMDTFLRKSKSVDLLKYRHLLKKQN